MRILFDFEIMINQRLGGVSKYFKEIILRMLEYPNVQIKMPVLFPRSIDLCEAFKRKLIFNYPDGAIRLLFPLNRFFVNPFLYAKDDIIHQTQYRLEIPSKIKSKVVVTVHDMIFEMFPDSDPGGVKKIQKYKAMVRADKIIAISNTTKRDIMRIYPEISDHKISVIYHGATDFSQTEVQYIKGLPEKYILFVGARAGYKNYIVFLKAVSELLRRDRELNIICTGNKDFDSEELLLAKQLDIDTQVFWHSCTDDELAYLYQNAICFVYPSLYEGFGLPILEAYSAKCPTVISDTDIFREIAGDASCFFDPTDVTDIRDKVSLVIESIESRTKLIDQGIERIKKYSWDKCARETFKVYMELQLDKGL